MGRGTDKLSVFKNVISEISIGRTDYLLRGKSKTVSISVCAPIAIFLLDVRKAELELTFDRPKLSYRTLVVLWMYYVPENTLQEIGIRFNVTRERVRQIIQKGLTAIYNIVNSKFTAFDIDDYVKTSNDVLLDDRISHTDNIQNLKEQWDESRSMRNNAKCSYWHLKNGLNINE